MYKNAKDKGITLVSLVVTIVILLILSTIAYEIGKGTMQSARLTAYAAEMQAMQQKVNELEQEYRNGDQTTKQRIENIGQSIELVSEDANTAFSSAEVSDTSGYRYYSSDTLKELELENFNQEFLVNVAKRDIISLKGVKYNGKTYYRFDVDDFPNSLYNVEKTEIASSISFLVDADIQNGMKIKIHDITYTGDVKKGTIYYGLGENVTKWIKASNETSDTSYTIDVLQEGTYQVKIIDTAGNESVPQTVTIHVPNYQIAETGTKYVTLGEAVNAAKNNETIKQIRNYTDATEVTVDGKSIKFDNNGRELTKTGAGITVKEGAGLEITGNGTIKGAENITVDNLISNRGTLNVKHSGTISNNYAAGKRVIMNSGSGTTYVSGSATLSSGSNTIYNSGTRKYLYFKWKNSWSTCG